MISICLLCDYLSDMQPQTVLHKQFLDVVVFFSICER